VAIKVLIVDDSAVVRRILSERLSLDPAIEVVGTAPDPFVARDKIVQLNPDVLLLDVEMPRMDGLTFLEKLMKHKPMRVIVVSSLAKDGGAVALRALELGAIDAVAKPSSSYSVSDMVEQLIEKVKAAASVRNVRPSSFNNRVSSTLPPVASKAMLDISNKIIAIGASTGGTEALREVLTVLPSDMPPILVVQHMPHSFTKAFADRLNTMCKLEVREAEQDEYVTPGKVLIAPGNKHMELRHSGARFYVELHDSPLVFHQRPAVDLLFRSVATYAGKNAMGVILTGMGKDGAQGLLEMKQAGALTIAQDEATSIVFGMPREAILLNAVDKVLALTDIPKALVQGNR